MREDKYILDDDGNPVVEPDLMKWATWYETADRQIADDVKNGVRISTVFLGLDHNYNEEGEPVLYETMVFGGPMDGGGERYRSKEAAIKGHHEYVEEILK